MQLYTILMRQGVKVDPQKIEALTDMPSSKIYA